MTLADVVVKSRKHVPEPGVCLLSGGQDSVTCLAFAANRHAELHTVSFEYGQSHSIELELAKSAAWYFGADHRMINIQSIVENVTSALLDGGDTAEAHPRLTDLPASFVPGRNALMLTVATAMIAPEVGATHVYAGMCQTDYSGYPDCRLSFIGALNIALDLGYNQHIEIVTPLMDLTKAETFALAKELGELDYILEMTHTCYKSDRTVRHPWGYGCGECPACKLRAKGWSDYVTNFATPV